LSKYWLFICPGKKQLKSFNIKLVLQSNRFKNGCVLNYEPTFLYLIMKKLFTLLLFFSIAAIGLRAQTTIMIRGDIDHHVVNQKVWINYFGTPSTCNIQDSTVTDSTGHFITFVTIGSGCSYGNIVLNMMGCQGIYDTLYRTLSYDSTTTNPDTMDVHFGYCDTCNIMPGYMATVSGFNASFTNTTPAFNPMYYTWYFGDGASVSNGGNANHTYASPGTYNVCLTALDAVKKCTYTYCSTVTIGANCGGFAANYTSSIAGTVVSFTNASSSGANQFFWDFGDATTSTAANPSHTYGKAGTYTVCLKVRDTINGCQDSICKTITVFDCTVFNTNFSAPITLTLTTNFINTSSSTATGYNWDFGDGNTSTATNPTHTYATSGTYTVCLYASDSVYGCSDSLCKNITVVDCSLLNAGFTDTVSGDTVWITNTTNTVSGTTNFYAWNFGDGTIVTTTNPSHIYSTSGTYNVCLSVGSTAGCKDTACTTVVIVSPCTSYSANYTSSASGYTASFTNTSTAGTNYNYWTFGDGNTSTAASPSHTYGAAGTYTVCLVAQNTSTGCRDTICQTVTIVGCSGFSANFIKTVLCQNAAFTNSSSSSANMFTWDFGDGSTSTTASPAHSYGAPGTYTVCLLAQDTIIGCQDTVCQTVTIDNSLSGTVYRDSSNLADSGIVYLIQVTIDTVANDTILTAIDSAYFSTATGGMYQFNTVPTGTYLIKAALLPGSAFYANRIPTYYMQEAQWRNATPVAVGVGCTTVDIELINGTNPGGSGFIGGYVSVGANKTGDPLEQIEVLLYNADNTPFGYAYTDANGQYKFDNIAFGSYKVVVDVLGKPCEEYFVTISNTNPSDDNGNFEVNTKNITIKKSGANGIGSIGRQNLALYPNPAANTVNVSFSAQNQGTATISIADVAGKQVLTAQKQINEGNNTIALDIAIINNGMYIITVNNGNNTYIGKLSINK
jgi:PKD repeat protein